MADLVNTQGTKVSVPDSLAERLKKQGWSEVEGKPSPKAAPVKRKPRKK